MPFIGNELVISKLATVDNRMRFVSLLFYVFGLSYISLKYRKDDSFVTWSRQKKRLNSKLNKIVLEYCSCVSFMLTSVPENQTREYVYEILVGIIDRHMNSRQKIQLKSGKGARAEFCRKALINCFISELCFLIKTSGKLLKKYQIDGLGQGNVKKINIALQFPEHSFAIPEISLAKVEKGPVFSSFAEYYSNQSNEPLWALESYIRPSKKFEKKSTDDPNADFQSLCTRVRKQVDLTSAITDFLRLLFRLLILPVRYFFGRTPLLVLINQQRKWLLSRQIISLIRSCESASIEICDIYVMPFNDLGDLRYTEDLSQKLVTFSYSQNIFVFPNYSSLNKNLYSNTDFHVAMSDISLKSLLYTGRHAGYTNLIRQIKNIKADINSYFGQIFILDESENTDEEECPVFLGFEQNTGQDLDSNSRYIGVYELPPESSYTQYARAICGDKVCDISNIKLFLNDIAVLCEKGYSIIYKPKYSLTNYPSDYRVYLEELTEKYGSKFLLLSPYTMANQVFESCFLTISMPYTSTYYVAKALGNESIYYLPENAGQWHCNSTSQDMVFGLNELLDVVQSAQTSITFLTEVTHGQ